MASLCSRIIMSLSFQLTGSTNYGGWALRTWSHPHIYESICNWCEIRHTRAKGRRWNVPKILYNYSRCGCTGSPGKGREICRFYYCFSLRYCFAWVWYTTSTLRVEIVQIVVAILLLLSKIFCHKTGHSYLGNETFKTVNDSLIGIRAMTTANLQIILYLLWQWILKYQQWTTNK